MALKSPLMPSPTSAFPSFHDSPSSPTPFANKTFKESTSNRSSAPSDSLAPPPSPYPQDIDPSPVDSNGTERTDIDEDAQEQSDFKTLDPAGDDDGNRSPDVEITSPESSGSDKPQRLNTQISLRIHSDSPDNDPQSVIHIPPGFKDFQDGRLESESQSNNHLTSPATPEPALSPGPKSATATSQLNTDVQREMDRSTPRAHTRTDLELEVKRKKRPSRLEDIPELNSKYLDDHEDDEDAKQPSTAGLVADGTMKQMQQSVPAIQEEIESLRAALSECWTLCNTLANLSSSHRTRTFKLSGKQGPQEQAWRSCWRLCQKLYDSRDEDHASQVATTLELCRDFCQSLFDVRQRGDPSADAVMRVSFELNNHLYNTHDRTLPDAFNERTLDFYVTLCHRLMKQRTCLPQETDGLLRACWALAEMLFNLRQSKREGRLPDEEQLGSAVQACWELCDIFREGWSQIRPDRGTPRPSQPNFPSFASTGSTRSNERSTSSLSDRQYVDASSGAVPETPTTIFDDTTAASSPDDTNAPNILVLGPAPGTIGSGGSTRGGSHHERWSSNASVLSGYSESTSSQRTSSTATAGGDENHLNRLRYLLIKAAIDTGYNRSGGQQLPTYAQNLPNTAFGDLPWQIKIFNYFQKLVTNDKSMINAHVFKSRRITAMEMAKSVRWLGRNDQWAWMRDLYRIVFGFGVDEAERRGGAIQV